MQNVSEEVFELKTANENFNSMLKVEILEKEKEIKKN